MDDYTDILERALQLAQEQYPQASPQKHAAFANSVAYLVTGANGGYGGPSVREHAASWRYTNRQYSFEEAVKLLLAADGPIFGPLTQLHRKLWQEEYCFDDDPQDIAELEVTPNSNLN